MVAEGRWYCSKICQRARGTKKLKNKEPVDGKFNYVTGLTYLELLEEVRRDAIRENDGIAMVSQWRLDMLSFHNRNHYKYIVMGHRLLSGNEKVKFIFQFFQVFLTVNQSIILSFNQPIDKVTSLRLPVYVCLQRINKFTC